MDESKSTAELLNLFVSAREALYSDWLDGIGHDVCKACSMCLSNHCCHQLVTAHVLEGMIAAACCLDSKSGPSVADVIKQGDTQLAIYKQYWQPALKKTTSLEERIALVEAGNKAWYDRNELCVFNVDGRCSIYNARPIACMSYYTRYNCRTKPAYAEHVETTNNENLVLRTFAAADLIAQRMFDYSTGIGLMPFTHTVATSLRCLRDIHFSDVHAETGAQA